MNANINEEIRKIRQFMNEGRFKEAYELCNKLLLNIPESGKLKRLQQNIEKIVYKQNVASIQKDLKELKLLWKEKKYGELVDKLKVLQSYVPGYAPVEKQLLKANKLYEKYLKKEQKGSIDSYIKTIEENIKIKKYQEALTLSKRFLMKFPKYPKCVQLLQKARVLLVDQKLKDNEYLLKSEKFEEVEEFLNNLLKIYPESRKVKELLKKVAAREIITVEIARKDFAFRSIDNLIILFQKKKYEKAVEGLKELLLVDPNNMRALNLLKKAEKGFNRQLNREVVVKMKKLSSKLKEERKKNKKDYIKI